MLPVSFCFFTTSSGSLAPVELIGGDHLATAAFAISPLVEDDPCFLLMMKCLQNYWCGCHQLMMSCRRRLLLLIIYQDSLLLVLVALVVGPVKAKVAQVPQPSLRPPASVPIQYHHIPASKAQIISDHHFFHIHGTIMIQYLLSGGPQNSAY